MTTEELKKSIRVIEDFPKEGIHFQDITTLFQSPEAFREACDRAYDLYKDKGITKVVALESRGFLIGSVLAYKLGAGLVLCRKAGKLPGEKVSQDYELEYGHDTIEMHTGSVTPEDVVLIHDDILATGGTFAAAYKLVSKFGPKKIYLNTLLDITACPRRPYFPADLPRTTVLEVDVD